MLLGSQSINARGTRDLNSALLGFSTVPPKQIIGMTLTDGRTPHDKKIYEEMREIRFDYPEEFIRETAAKIHGLESTKTTNVGNHEKFNEVAMYRRNIELKNNSEEKMHGRIMPDYIVVIGKATSEDEKLADQFAKDGKPIPIIEIDQKAYGDRSKERAKRKEDHTVERKSGDIVKEVRKIAEKDDEECR